MLKKISVVILALILCSSAFAKIGIELRGGMSLINPKDYNDDFTNAFQRIYSDPSDTYSNLPSDVMGTKLSQMLNGGLNIKYFLDNSIAIGLRGDYLNCDYDDIITVDGVDTLYSHIVLSTAYAGLGVSYYMNLSPSFAFYASADGGAFIHIDSFYETGSFADAASTAAAAGLPQGAYVNDFMDMFFGGNAELGMQVLVSESLGFSAYGGYRIASMPLTYKKVQDVEGAVNLRDANDLYAFPSPKTDVFVAKTLDISGPYFGIGLVLYFGAEPLPAEASAAAPAKPAASADAGAKSKYEQYGDAYFKQKNYKYALQYYSGALKQAPNAGLYKKIGLCYYYMKNNAKALQYMKTYAEKNPSDPQIQQWLKALQK